MIFKSIKKAFLWTAYLLLLLILVVVGGYLALRSPKVQTKITQYIAEYLSEELNTEVEVQGVDIGFFNRVILEGLYVEDLKGDTLANLSKLYLSLRYLGIDKQEVRLGKVQIDDLTFHLHKYEGDEKLNLQFLIDYFSVPKDTADAPSWNIKANELELVNASFKLRNHYSESKPLGIDYKDLDVRRINLHIDEIEVDSDTVYGNLTNLSCYEKRGFYLKKLKGKAKVSPTELKVDELEILTALSDLKLDLHYTYQDWVDYKDFVDAVRMDYHFERSVVNLKDVAFFAPALEGLNQTLQLSGHIYGPVSSLNARNLELDYGSGTRLTGNIDMDGLPNIKETFLFFDLKNFSTTYRDLASIPQPPFSSGKSLKIPNNIANLGRLNFKGSFTGFLNDFVAYGKLNTSIGSLQTDISLKQEASTGKLAYSGSLKSTAFNVGKFLDEDRLGKVTLKATVQGRGLTKSDLNAKLVGTINSAEIIGYDYKDIEVNGEFAESMFSGEVSVADTNLNLIFRGGFDLSQELPQFNFYSDVRHANLYELNLLRERDGAIVSGVVEVDFKGDDIDNLVGLIELTNGSYQQTGDDKFEISSFQLDITETENAKDLQLRSGVIDADFNGKFSFKEIKTAANNLLRKHLPSYAGTSTALKDSSAMDFRFSIELKRPELLTYFLAPGLEIGDSTSFSGSYKSTNSLLDLQGFVSSIGFGSVRMNDVEISANNPSKEFQLGIKTNKLNLTDSLFLSAFSLKSFTFNDSLGMELQWDNETVLENRGFIKGIASFPKNKEVSFHLIQSDVTVAGLDWIVDEGNLLKIDTTAYEFTDFRFINETQSIGVNGKISRDPRSKLQVKLNQFDLSNFNPITLRKGLKFDGIVSGKADVSGIYDKLFLTNQLRVDSLVLNDVEIGSGEINNTWIPATESIQVFGLLNRNDKTSLSVVGEFFPGKDKPQNFNIKAMVDQLPLSVFDPYIDKVITDVKGIAKADLSLKGKLDAPELSGYVVLKQAELLFTYLNTRYRISDTVSVKKDGFYFKNLTVLDERDRTARINGWVKHDKFKNFQFDANLTTEEFMALNTNSAMNSLYYGKAFGTGTARFYGEPKNMHLKLAMRTDRGTKFNIPLYGAKNVDETDFITFVKPKGLEDDVELDLSNEFKVSFQNLTLEMDVEATDDAEIQLIFDPAVGDIIKGRGNGDLNISLDRSGNFKMFGDYYIKKGEYLFTLQNVINKKFLIQQGGTINWSGSPYEALVNITANYGVRTSLYELMYPDTSNDNYKRRIQVDCILNMSGNLLTPNIDFDINLPNSDEQTLTEVKNRIGVGNVQEMNRQVFGLLVLNRFFPTENQNQALQQAGGFFSSSTSEMVSNQLSNWLSKISNDFDVGLNYRPGDDITSDEIQVALSTQLFNNRIIIDGNVGVANTQSSSSNIVGDVNIEYKITPDGRLRVRAFNVSNDINSLRANAPFTQGVGLSYQKEFNKLGDLFRRKKKKDEL